MISPESSSMSEDKAAFLARLMSETQSKNKSEMLPFLLSLSTRVNQSGLSFSDEETDLIISQLTSGFSPQERKKVEMLRQFSKMLSARKPPPR